MGDLPLTRPAPALQMMMLAHVCGQGGGPDLDVEYSDNGQGRADGSTSRKIAIQPENTADMLNGKRSPLKIDLRAWTDMRGMTLDQILVRPPARSPFQLSCNR
jgi:hypothetical protein